MRGLRSALLGALVGLVVCTGSAQAANTNVVDPVGGDPHGYVDGSGTLHLVWRERPNSSDQRIGYCAIPRGNASRCAAPPRYLPAPGGETRPSTDPPFIYAHGTTRKVVQHNWGGTHRTYVWTADGAGVFGQPVLAAENGPRASVPSPGVQEGDGLVTQHGLSVQGLSLGGGVTDGAFATLTPAGSHVGFHEDLERVPGGNGVYIASAETTLTSQTAYWVSTQGDVNTSANWSMPKSLPTPGAARMAAGGLGLFAVTIGEAGTPLHVHRWTGSGFDAGVDLPGLKAALNDVDIQEAGGRLWVVGSTYVDGSTAGLAVWSSTDGVSWTQPYLADASTDQFRRLRIAVAQDGQGFAMFERLGAFGAVVTDLTPKSGAVPPGNRPPSGTLFTGRRGTSVAKLAGSLLLFQGPAVCVPVDRRITTGFRVKDGRTKALVAKGLVRPISITFRLLGPSLKPVPGKTGRLAAVRKTPFVAKTLSTAGLAKGKTHAVGFTVRYRLTGTSQARKRIRTFTFRRKLQICG